MKKLFIFFMLGMALTQALQANVLSRLTRAGTKLVAKVMGKKPALTEGAKVTSCIQSYAEDNRHAFMSSERYKQYNELERAKFSLSLQNYPLTLSLGTVSSLGIGAGLVDAYLSAKAGNIPGAAISLAVAQISSLGMYIARNDLINRFKAGQRYKNAYQALYGKDVTTRQQMVDEELKKLWESPIYV